MRRAWFRSPLLVLAFVLAGAGVAEASAVCTRLKAQLANVSSNDGSSAKFRRYADAVTKQGQQIRKVRADLGRYGCTSGSIIVRGGQNAKACAKLTAAHTKMRANIAALERKRDSFARNDSKTTKRRIQAAIQANDCDGQRASIQAAALKGEIDRKRSKSPGLVAILDNSGGDRVTASSQARARIRIEPKASRGGNYRTLCVRSCDGFFFPVSSSASPSDFPRDERTCQMMCPGTKTALYFHAANGQESEEMVSARSRAPYTEMPNAFAYRTANAPMSKACSCNMGAFFKEMARREAILNGTAEQDAPVTTWVRPFNRPDPGEDPESVLDAEMRLTSEDVAAVIAASRAEHPLTDEHREVRMVGPTFLPDQAGHLDLKANTDWAIR
ncbi:DUF2865 domain-containing protein [Hoeflea sp. G2-23]|uniref:DUF2865 domain-containing protein n=1 Tax=Hoeflea algicola TaxID=2983763 RepID=A0ABT3Z6N4_9HYPH|nr:DUF2865 domain-containing protein [Hoeflea algicola]MCY0147303.1 DUF2865 domain-containing protein [Hoeflea algicola]